MAWYQQWSSMCSASYRVPLCLAVESRQDEMFMLLEDLDDSGFPVRKSQVSMIEIKACLSWLAIFMGKQPDKLWEVGAYWHLETRPDELQALQNMPLKKHALRLEFLVSSLFWAKVKIVNIP